MGTRSLSQQESGWGVVLTIRPLLVLRFCVGRGIAVPLLFALNTSYRVTFIQGVPGGMDKTLGECSLC